MKDALIEAVIIALAIYLGLGQIADALREVKVDMQTTTTVRFADEAPDDDTP